MKGVTRVALAGVVTACAGAIYVVLIPLWFLRRAADRRAAASLPELDIDRYHAIAAATPRSDRDVYEAVAAALLLDGLITITPEGVVTVTDRGGDPAHAPGHPVEAALLECFGSPDGPVALSKIRETDEVHRRLKAFLREQDARLTRWSSRGEDGIASVAGGTAMLLTLFYAVQLTYFGELRPSNVGEFLLVLVPMVVLWLLIFVPLVWFIGKIWPERKDLFREHCAGLPPHPAIKALGSDNRALLYASKWYATPAELEERERMQRAASEVNTGMDTF